MTQKVFKRVEQKYVLNEAQYQSLQELIDIYFAKDKYHDCKIYNIYFDNDNFDSIINSIEKPKYKSKVRLRSYGQASKKDNVYLEVKQKYKGVVYKRRIDLTLDEYYKYQDEGIYPDKNKQIIKEIDYHIKYHNLHPAIFVAYDRLSYYAKEDKNFRVTFDTNLRSRFKNLLLKDTRENENFFDEQMYIMEVKCLNSLPLWFANELSKLKIYPSSFSKVGNIYMKERGKENVREYFTKHDRTIYS